MSEESYSVCQFFVDESYEYVRRFVTAEEAAKAYAHYTTSVGAQMGTTIRVIIVDSGDLICAEWTRKDGHVWPKKES